LGIFCIAFLDVEFADSHLRERLNRILSSKYFTMIPELKTVDEQVAVAAVVSGAEQYASEFLIHGPSTGEAVSDVSAFLSSQVSISVYKMCFLPYE
jgi:hypothetical protein